eukprot:s3013_g3.t1
MEDCPIVRSLGQIVSSGKPFMWLPNELPYFAMSPDDVQISADKCRLHYADRVDDFVPVFKEQLQFSRGLAGEVAEPSHPAHPVERPAQVDPDAQDHSSDGDDEGEEPIDRMRRLVADAESLQHKLLHFPKNPACPICNRSRMYRKKELFVEEKEPVLPLKTASENALASFGDAKLEDIAPLDIPFSRTKTPMSPRSIAPQTPLPLTDVASAGVDESGVVDHGVEATDEPVRDEDGQLPFSAGIPPGESEPALINCVASTIDEAFVRSRVERAKYRRMNTLAGTNTLFEFACSDDSTIGQQAEAVGVSCIRLSRSTLDLCDPEHVQQAIGQLEALPGSASALVTLNLSRSAWLQEEKGVRAVLKEAQGLRDNGTWDDNFVIPVTELRRKARQKGEKIKIAEVLTQCGIKHHEMSPEHHRYKGRIVYRGDAIRDEHHQYVLFEDTATTPTALAALNLTLWFGCMTTLSCADCIQAYLQCDLDDKTWVILPYELWLDAWKQKYDKDTKLAVRLIRSLYGHPQAGSTARSTTEAELIAFASALFGEALNLHEMAEYITDMAVKPTHQRCLERPTEPSPCAMAHQIPAGCKGGGKGGWPTVPHHQANQPVVYYGANGLEVKGRRRLEDVAFEDILAELQGQLTEQLNQAGSSVPVIQDLDLSQNKLTADQFENLFVSLGVASARVVRFRLFGCPTFDDQVMLLLAEYLRANLTKETAPAEMHLSDCAITSEGFKHLMSVIEESDVYPLRDERRPDQGWPLYLRLENNYISNEAIQEKIDSGLIQLFTKQWGAKKGPVDGPKVNLLGEDWNFRQRSGKPPSPEASASRQIPIFGTDFSGWIFRLAVLRTLLFGSQCNEHRCRLLGGKKEKMEQSKRVSFSEDPKKSTVKASKGPGEKWKVGPQYEVKQLIGTGSYGSVCEAFDTSKRCLVAVKRIGHMFEDLVDCKRILREIAILSKLKHLGPNIPSGVTEHGWKETYWRSLKG